jgi:hypothetical protein
MTTDTKGDDAITAADTDKTKEMMAEIMKELASNIHLSNIIFKTGRTSSDTQSDFKKGAILIFRDQVILLAYKHMIDMFNHEQRKNANKPVNAAYVMARIMDEANTQVKNSFKHFEHLYSHLRKEHKEEILNVAKSLNLDTTGWQDG